MFKLRKFASSYSGRQSVLLIESAPWPFFVSLGVYYLIVFILLLMRRVTWSLLLDIIFRGVVFLIIGVWCWFRDLIRESLWKGRFTYVTQYFIRVGIYNFILSEFMLFLGFFWAAWYYSGWSTIWVGLNCPCVGVLYINNYGFAFLNTLALFIAGSTVIWIRWGKRTSHDIKVFIGFSIMLIVASLFIFNQFMEWWYGSFTWGDSIMGTTFYFLTGVHFMHAVIGGIAMSWNFFLYRSSLLLGEDSLIYGNTECYWLFVDYMWVLVNLFSYGYVGILLKIRFLMYAVPIDKDLWDFLKEHDLVMNLYSR